MLFQIYGDTAVYQLLGWLMVFVGLILANEFARRTKWGALPASWFCLQFSPFTLSPFMWVLPWERNGHLPIPPMCT